MINCHENTYHWHSRLCRLKSRECSIKSAYSLWTRYHYSREKKGIVKTFTWNDLANDNLPDVDMIIHLAGKAHDTKNQSQANVYFEINTELTKKIYDYFLDRSIKKFVFFSSVKAAADSVPGDILTEDVVPSPVGPYGESKIAAEQYILNMKAECTNKDKQFYILRPCMIHGPGNKGNLNLLYSVVNKVYLSPLGSFDNRRIYFDR